MGTDSGIPGWFDFSGLRQILLPQKMKRIEEFDAVTVGHVKVGRGLHQLDNSLVDVVGRVAANLVELVRGTVLNKLVGDAETHHGGREIMVGHKLKNSASEAALKHSVFYGDDFVEPSENTE